MRLLKRNLQAFEYRAYEGKEEAMTDNGRHTGHYDAKYADPVRYMGNISEARGNAAQTMFGRDVNYTHVLVVDDPNADINETGLIDWKDNTYIITAVKKSINVLSVALRQQTKNTVPDGWW